MKLGGTSTAVTIICNPTAGSGRAARQLPALERALAQARIDHLSFGTERVGDATRLAHEARERGARAIVVIGGDGTLNEVSQAYLDADGAPLPAPPVALLCAGSGDDFGRDDRGVASEAMPRLVARLTQLRTRSIDLGVLTLQDAGGRAVRRAFVNVVSVGISGCVDELVARRSKYIGGKAAYSLAALRALMSYRNVPLELRLDGRPWYRERTYIAAIANGRYFGGGHQIAPNAKDDDGILDVVCLADFSRRAVLALGGKIRRGEHVRDPRVHTGAAQLVEVFTEQPVLVDVDGETPGFSPLAARIVPNAMRWIVD